MRALCRAALLSVLLLVGPLASTQEVTKAEEGRWLGASLSSRILFSGVQASLGVRELLDAGVDVRFDLAYLPFVLGMPAPGQPPSPPPLVFELGANALGYTSRPALAAPALAFVAYGGGGPRLLALLDAPGVVLGAGGLGGFELRYAQLGLFLEADASLALVGIGSQGFEFGPVLIPIPKLSLGLNYHF